MTPDFAEIESALESKLGQDGNQGFLLACPQNERPLQGLAGWIDWRTRGAISAFLKTGAVTGAPGELTLLPISWRSQPFQLLLVGIGPVSSPGDRPRLPVETLHSMQRNISSLGYQTLRVSRSDFGGVDAEYFVRHLKGTAVQSLP